MASSKDIDPAIQQLTEASVNMAVGSIDYAINAKAIAMQAAEVTDRLREVLAKGYRLKVIEPITGFGSSLLDFRLQFRFESDNIIDVGAEDFVVAVDLPTKSVTRILHPDASMPAGTVPAPFAVAMPSDAANILVPASELVQRRERTRAFFAERGLPEFPGMTREMTPGGKTTSTADSTGEDSTTYCTEYGPQGQVYTSQKDDNRTDYWTDYNPDSVTDQNWDPTH